MNRYIALLRGINISGKNKIAMSELKEILNNAPDWWSRTTISNISDNITIRTANTVRKIINK